MSSLTAISRVSYFSSLFIVLFFPLSIQSRVPCLASRVSCFSPALFPSLTSTFGAFTFFHCEFSLIERHLRGNLCIRPRSCPSGFRSALQSILGTCKPVTCNCLLPIINSEIPAYFLKSPYYGIDRRKILIEDKEMIPVFSSHLLYNHWNSRKYVC